MRGGRDTSQHTAKRFWLLLAALSAACPLFPQQTSRDLAEAPLEELMNIKITIASKKEQALAAAPAAVYVITEEDIRRSGLTTLPEVLRLAPGVEVAQVASSMWAVSLRGDNTLFATRLLVLVDGRSVYSPAFSGVFWSEQDIPLEDVERIEVIRGPGATLWGANAVNGVVNVITHPASATLGTLIEVGGGSEETTHTYARYGGALGKRGQYRSYLRYVRRGDLPRLNATDASDAWSTLRAGFRSDWRLGSSDSLTAQGDVNRSAPGDTRATAGVDSPFPGYGLQQNGNLLARWTHSLRPGSAITLQTYVDSARETFRGLLRLNHTIVDTEAQHNLTWGRHELIWGGGFRWIQQRSWGTAYFHYTEPMQTRNLSSGFAQDEITLGRASLTLGSRFEANSFTGVEIQPTVRLLVKASPRMVGWAAVSRAARTPNEVEALSEFSTPRVVLPWGAADSALLLRNPHPESEHILAYELGFRFDPARRLHVEMAGFYNHVDHVATLRPVSFTDHHLVAVLQNGGTGSSFGAEATAAWIVRRPWKITGSYSWLQSFMRDRFGMPSFGSPGDNPRHQFQIHSLLSLPKRLEIDTSLYYVGRLPAQPVPAYARVDVRLGWRPASPWEFSVAGRNLTDGTHPEFVTGLSVAPILVRRSVLATVKFRF